MVQHFTHRAETVDSSIAREATPPSPEAEGAEYKTASLIVGETPLRIYAKNSKTLGEIQDILIQSDLVSGEELNNKTSSLSKDLQSLGFHANTLFDMYGVCTSGSNATGYVEGNDVKRSEAQERATQQNVRRAEVDSFQSCQPPDKAKMAGAKFLVALNFLFNKVKTCAEQCTSANEQVAGRKQVMEELLKICNDTEYQITVPKQCVGRNEVGLERTFFPLLNGIGETFYGILADPNTRKISCERLKELENDYGHEFVEQLVQTAYRTFPSDKRPELKAAYEEYCTQTKKSPTDLDKLLFNDHLRELLSNRKTYLDLQKRNSEIPISGALTDFESEFQMWLNANKQVEKDGSITIDLGHIKIMVNEEQLKYVTLESLGAL
jgi:hypothetical protein